jgi:uncharacterized protein YndB with AHSA1/START domain
MNNQPIVIERVYDAPVSKVWKALTDKDEMKQWYFQLSDFRAEPGFEFRFYGEGSKGEKYLHVCKVTEAVKEKKLAYSWRYDGFEGNSLLTFELFPEGNNTRLKLTHAGLESFPQNNPDFASASFEAGWTEITGKSLKEFVEKKSD